MLSELTLTTSNGFNVMPSNSAAFSQPRDSQPLGSIRIRQRALHSTYCQVSDSVTLGGAGESSFLTDFLDDADAVGLMTTHQDPLPQSIPWIFLTISPLLQPRIWLPGGSDSKESACNAGDLGSILGLRRSPGKGSGYPLQHSCPRIPRAEEPRGLQFTGLQRVGHD